MPQTLYDKLWDSHLVHVEDDGTALLYIDRHLVHEVTSAQAYEGLRAAGRKPWRTESVVATADHNTPTTNWDEGLAGVRDPFARLQIETLDANMREFGAKVYFPYLDKRQGIVHVIGPEQGATLPGMTVVCGDSHTSTHGAFACLAHGIGTPEVEHVLATQCLVTKKMKNMRINVEGPLARGVTAKDVVLAIIGRIGTAGGTGYAIEFAGSTLRSLSMEGRMTGCNMAIEAGARADHRHSHRQGVHRLVHQLAHRGPARRRIGGERQARRIQRQARPGRAGLGPGEGAGRARRPRPRLPRRRLRMARARLLDVPRHESGPALCRRALRLDLQPQLRGPPGPGRADASGESRHGGRGRHRRPLRRHPAVELAMDKFTVVNGVVAPLDRANVDTDQIIPKQYLASIKRTGFAQGLFAEWCKDPQFVLNQPRYKGATILLARKNFGCGSSPEPSRRALVH